MKDKNLDFYTFFPKEDSPKEVIIRGLQYKVKGELLDASEIGDCYHILLFKEKEDSTTEHLDYYDAILIDPLEYMSSLIPQGWFGMIGKKTTTSTAIFDDTFDKLKQTC